jgi:hypothetical protein
LIGDYWSKINERNPLFGNKLLEETKTKCTVALSSQGITPKNLNVWREKR